MKVVAQNNERRRKVAAAVAGTLLGVVTTVLVASAALAKDVDDITVAEGQTLERDYGPIAAVEPPIGPLFGNVGQRAPAFCKDNGTWCDTIDLNIRVPESYSSADFFKVTLELTWANPSGTNDLNMYVHRENGTQVLFSASATQPERITLQDPPERKYLIVVNNIQGPNTGYHLKVEFVPQGSIPSFEEEDDFAFGPSPSGSAADTSTGGPSSSLTVVGGSASTPLPALSPPPPASNADPTSGPRPIDNAGPDGPASTRTLVAMAASSVPAASSNAPIFIATALAVVAAAVLGAVLVVRTRRDADF